MIGCLAAMFGCTGADARSAVVVRDSAGIMIVENAAPGEDTPRWSLADTPEVVIGTLEGPPEVQLFRVRAALRLADGRIAVVNGGTNEIRLFDAAGGHIQSIGRDGEGPGEFRGLGALFAFRDSLFAADRQLMRISALGADGTFARSFPMPHLDEQSWPWVAGVFDNGTILVERGRSFFAGKESTGVVRDSSAYYRMDRSGTIIDTLGTFPGMDAYVHVEVGSMSVRGLRFGRNPSATAAGSRFYHGSGDHYEVRIFTADGALERIIRLDRPPRAVTPADIELAKAHERAEIDDSRFRELNERVLAAMPLPSTMPAFSEVEVAVNGNLWVQSYRAPGEESNAWTVFDAEGRLLAEIDLPVQLTVFEIGPDWVLGRRTDDFDVERVELHRLVRNDL